MVEIANIEEMRETIFNDKLCKKIGEALVAQYPDRRWMVRVFDKGRVATIILHSLNTEFGNTVKMLDGKEAINIKRCLMAAGEALERFNLTRGRSDNADILSLSRNKKGDVSGSSKGIYDGK